MPTAENLWTRPSLQRHWLSALHPTRLNNKANRARQLQLQRPHPQQLRRTAVAVVHRRSSSNRTTPRSYCPNPCHARRCAMSRSRPNTVSCGPCTPRQSPTRTWFTTSISRNGPPPHPPSLDQLKSDPRLLALRLHLPLAEHQTRRARRTRPRV